MRLVFHTVLVFALYLLFAGHNQPGGGFVGGLVAGAAFVLRYVAGGRARAARRRCRSTPASRSALGLLRRGAAPAWRALAVRRRSSSRAARSSSTLPVLGDRQG